MSRPWSKLQKELYLIRAEGLNVQIHCAVYRMESKYGCTDLPRYWITLEKEIIWDYPKDFVGKLGEGYPYSTSISYISQLIREYIDTPKEKLYGRIFENDYWGLTNILKASDRRIGVRRLPQLKKKIKNKAAQKVLKCRL